MGKDFAKKIAAGAVWLLIWLLCWLTVGKDVLIPSPAAVLLRLGQLICTLPFWQQVGLSLLRILTGFALALVLGAVFGALTARSASSSSLMSLSRRTPAFICSLRSSDIAQQPSYRHLAGGPRPLTAVRQAAKSLLFGWALMVLITVFKSIIKRSGNS